MPNRDPLRLIFEQQNIEFDVNDDSSSSEENFTEIKTSSLVGTYGMYEGSQGRFVDTIINWLSFYNQSALFTNKYVNLIIVTSEFTTMQKSI